ncbi:hypothetical protein VTH82DRAFT_8518 [Thermothelomyces myriococcoides]
MWDQIPFLETREEQDIAVDQGDETPSSEQNQQQVSREKSDEVPTSTSSRSLISSTSSASPILSSGGVSNELAHGALGIQSPSGGEDSDTEARFRRSLELTATWQYGEHAQKALSNGKRDTEQEDFGSGDQELALPSITSDDSSSQRFGVASPGVSQASGYFQGHREAKGESREKIWKGILPGYRNSIQRALAYQRKINSLGYFSHGNGAPRPGESRTDIMIRDQIARCEAIRGQRLSDGEKEVIRSYYRQMNRRHAPCEVSEPSIVRSAAEPTKLEVLGRRSGLSSESGGSSNHGNHGRSSPVTSGDLPAGAQNDEYAGDSNNTVELSELLGMIQDLKTRLKETQSHLMRERQETERRLEKLEKGHQDVMAVLNELRIGRSGSDPGGAVYTHVLSGQAMRANGLGFNPTLAVVALAAMVWLVTEAMLHSKRLSDGYGPFINGGYNGLASVVVFGTWTQFTFFITASTYLGVVSVLGALRR